MNPRRSRSPILGVALTAAVLGGVALAAAPLEAQRPPVRKPAPVVEAQPTPGLPCCSITAIDVRSGRVTARNAATGESFRFRVSDAGLLRGLTVGQKVYRAEGSDRAGITPAEPCCEIVAAPAAANPAAVPRPTPAQPVDGIAPCCNITAIDVRSGLVTARNAATGESFRFRVTDAGLLRGLTVGQKVYRAEGSDRAGITPVDPCCTIVSVGAEPVADAQATPGSPCCGIIAIDVRGGLVTARNAATGESFRFRVTDAGLLRGLTVGQKVYRAEGSDRAGFTPGDPCCAIVAAPGAGGA